MKTKHWQRIVTCGISLLLASLVNGQVMYNLRGGIMPGKVHTDMEHDENLTESRIDWMIGFELEIPISQKWNIETGLRYKSKSYVAYKDYDFGSYWYNEDYLAKHPEEDFNQRLYRTYLNASILELPIRATYKFHLNDNFALHLGFGPYASFNLTGKPFNSGMPFKSSALSVGIEPSVALYYKNVSIGAIYNNPIIFKQHKEMDSNCFMITVGFRFDNRVFKSIGRGIEKAADSGALDIISNTANQIAENIGEYNRAKQELMENSYSTPSSPSSSSSRSSSSPTNGNKYDIGEQQNYNTAKKAWGNYDSMLSEHFYGGRSATRSEVQKWQNEMKKLRNIWKTKGKSFPNSSNENKSISSCLNTAHSH